MNKLLLRALPVAAYLLPIAAAAQDLQSYFDTTVRGIIGVIINILIVLATLMLILGIFRYITSGGDEEKLKSGRSYILYGIIGIALMVLIRGFINIAIETIQPGLDTSTPSAPTL